MRPLTKSKSLLAETEMRAPPPQAADFSAWRHFPRRRPKRATRLLRRRRRSRPTAATPPLCNFSRDQLFESVHSRGGVVHDLPLLLIRDARESFFHELL